MLPKRSKLKSVSYFSVWMLPSEKTCFLLLRGKFHLTQLQETLEVFLDLDLTPKTEAISDCEEKLKFLYLFWSLARSEVALIWASNVEIKYTLASSSCWKSCKQIEKKTDERTLNSGLLCHFLESLSFLICKGIECINFCMAA